MDVSRIFALMGLLSLQGGWAQAPASLEVGSEAPDFALNNQDGKAVRLRDFRGKKWVVLAFFPKAHTSGCTREMVSLRDAAKELEALEVHILALSADDVATQKSFCVAQGLNFTLLSDPDGSVAQKYGSWQPGRNVARRDTIIVDPQGKVRHIWRGVKELERHGQDLVALIQKLRQEGASP